jgi:hypothetical protein
MALFDIERESYGGIRIRFVKTLDGGTINFTTGKEDPIKIAGRVFVENGGKELLTHLIVMFGIGTTRERKDMNYVPDCDWTFYNINPGACMQRGIWVLRDPAIKRFSLYKIHGRYAKNGNSFTIDLSK